MSHQEVNIVPTNHETTQKWWEKLIKGWFLKKPGKSGTIYLLGGAFRDIGWVSRIGSLMGQAGGRTQKGTRKLHSIHKLRLHLKCRSGRGLSLCRNAPILRFQAF